MKRNFLTYILLCILLLGSAACQDDPLYNGGETGEGESLISATVKFKPLTPALNGNTRTAGNVIKNIEDLCVLLYNEKGELLKTYPLPKEQAKGNINCRKTKTDRITIPTRIFLPPKHRRPMPTSN